MTRRVWAIEQKTSKGTWKTVDVWLTRNDARDQLAFMKSDNNREYGEYRMLPYFPLYTI